MTTRIGVVGAGTMGSEIALAAASAGRPVVLHDSDPGALERAECRLAEVVERALARRHGDVADLRPTLSRVTYDPELGALRGCELVIEAVPEVLELKRKVLGHALGLCGDRVVLATNTSSLRVSAIASGLQHPGRLVGMHFFNPAHRMRLVEIVASAVSDGDAIAAATRLAADMGKTPIPTEDVIGFVVNRCARPFYGEAVRLVADGYADVETVDRLARDAAGFRLGPFELMDLIGVDVNLDIQRSFFEQSFGEPRWRPHPLQEGLVAAGRLGRKTAWGFYRYETGKAVRAASAPTDADEPTGPVGSVEVRGQPTRRRRPRKGERGWPGAGRRGEPLARCRSRV